MKKHIKIINDIVKSLPEEEYVTNGYPCQIMGSKLIEEGHTHVEGKEIISGKCYYHSPVIKNSVNHKRRAIRAFKKNGVEGLFSYVKPLIIAEKRLEYKQKLIQALS